MIDPNNLKEFNKKLATAHPAEIIKTALQAAKRPVVTTNFRPYEVALLHAVSVVNPRIPVVWCDTGYNTRETYKHAIYAMQELRIDVTTYVPLQTAAYRDVAMGIPDIEDPLHKEFTRQVKIEPFQRAMKHFKPDVWFTNLRAGQTAYRDSIDIFSYSTDGILKVCPFYHYKDEQLDAYLDAHDLRNEFHYYDPTKVLSNRECGLHG